MTSALKRERALRMELEVELERERALRMELARRLAATYRTVWDDGATAWDDGLTVWDGQIGRGAAGAAGARAKGEETRARCREIYYELLAETPDLKKNQAAAIIEVRTRIAFDTARRHLKGVKPLVRPTQG